MTPRSDLGFRNTFLGFRSILAASAVSLALLAGPVSAGPALAGEQPYTPAAMAAAQAEGRPVVVHVTAPWCSTCQAQKPIVAALIADPRFAAVTVFDVDFDSQKAVLRKLDVRAQSTLIAFRGRRETARSSGDTDRASIARLFGKAV